MENSPQSGDGAKPIIHLVRAENLPSPYSLIKTCCSLTVKPEQHVCEIPKNAERCSTCQKKEKETPPYLKTFQFAVA